jgi:pimeloyl-ACP methyl ester carboxylesterase
MSTFARLLVSALLVTLFGVVVAPGGAQAGDPSWATCSQQTVPVTLSPSGSTYNLVGRLCLRTDSVRGSRTVQLLVPGITYDQNYFNSSHSPNSYSYVYAATSRGYSTFAIDRLGTGLSDKPAPDLLTTQSHAYVVGQLVQKLRAGAIGGRAFSMVVGVGHSFGAGILQYLAATATVAATVPDYLVLESFLTTTHAPTLTLFAGSMHAATADPKFASSGLPDGYITTIPGTRDDLFLYASGVETAMPAYEESIKSLATTTERASVGAARGGHHRRRGSGVHGGRPERRPVLRRGERPELRDRGGGSRPGTAELQQRAGVPEHVRGADRRPLVRPAHQGP